MQNGRFRNPLSRQPLFAPDQNGTLPTTPNPGQHLDHRPSHPIHDPLLIKRPRDYLFIFHNRQYVILTIFCPLYFLFLLQFLPLLQSHFHDSWHALARPSPGLLLPQKGSKFTNFLTSNFICTCSRKLLLMVFERPTNFIVVANFEENQLFLDGIRLKKQAQTKP